jgi:mono/diheme cytochrome c family protein
MKHSHRNVLTAVIALTVFSAEVFAQAGRVDVGQREFESSCAVCHGVNGTGNGPYWEILQQPRRATDLTTLATRNGGVFPVSRIYDMIENGGSVPAHGTRDMPIWGTVYRIQAGPLYSGVQYDPEAYVRTRILALIEYLDRLQLR